MICFKCKKDFPENQIEVSHDFPKYLGGTDKDGRHNLCVKHHEDYDFQILSKIILQKYNIKIEKVNDRRKYIQFHNKIKRDGVTNEDLKIVKQVMEAYF